MTDKGGTPFSILRSLFIYWDADKTGFLTAEDLKHCMTSLGIQASDADLREIVNYYSKKKDGRMTYIELLADIQKGEPTITEFSMKSHDEDIGARFTEFEDEYKVPPEEVKQFIEAARHIISDSIRANGGTPFSHLHKIFERYDFDFSSGLSADELVHASKKHLKMTMSMEDARAIVRYYDRKRTGDIYLKYFLDDLASGFPSMLHFHELTNDEIREKKNRLAVNRFIRKPFKARPNMLLERMKDATHDALEKRVMGIGGTYTSWVQEAFQKWDPRDHGILTRWRDLQGAMKRIGVEISQDEAISIMSIYNDPKRGGMNYKNFTKDIVLDDPNFLEDTTNHIRTVTSISSRTPPGAHKIIDKFKRSAEAYGRKSKGVLIPKDMLLGTFLRFDPQNTGRLDATHMMSAADELGFRVPLHEANLLVQWFDTDGSMRVDYNELVRMLYGDDVVTSTTPFPSVSRGNGGNKIDPYSSAGAMSALGWNDFAKTPSATAGGMKAQNDRAFQNLATASSQMGTGLHDMTKLLDPQRAQDMKLSHLIETKAIRHARRQMRKDMINSERSQIQSKLESVDKQRKAIIDEYKARKHRESMMV
jgi:Ca2+-binding EF-hand superfamily protein